MKSGQAVTKLPVRAPLPDHKGKSPSTAPARSQSSQKPLGPASILTDVPPLKWKKRTSSSPQKSQPISNYKRSRPDLTKKSSVLGLRRGNLPVDSTDSQTSRRRSPALKGVKKKMSTPEIKRIPARQLHGIATCPPMADLYPGSSRETPTTPPTGKNGDDLPGMGRPSTSQISSLGSCRSSPYSPKPSRKTTPMVPPPDDSDDDPPDPRFMLYHGQPGKRAADTVPDEILPFKMPTIIGMTPRQARRTKWPVKQGEQVTSATPVNSAKVPGPSVKRTARVPEHKSFKARCKDVSKQFTRKRMFIRAHRCAKVFRAISRRKRLDIPVSYSLSLGACANRMANAAQTSLQTERKEKSINNVWHAKSPLAAIKQKCKSSYLGLRRYSILTIKNS